MQESAIPFMRKRAWKVIREALRKVAAHNKDADIREIRDACEIRMENDSDISDLELSIEQIREEEEDRLLEQINAKVEAIAAKQRALQRLRSLREVNDILKNVEIIPSQTNDEAEIARSEGLKRGLSDL